MARLYIFIFFLIIISNSFSQNEFYNNGSIVYVNNKTNTTTASLRVNGSITNNNGSFTNNVGLIEVTKDWTNTSTTNYYVSTGIERFTDTFNQIINGVWNGTASNQNQFYDLKIDKPQTRGQYISLNTNTNINSNGSLVFENDSGIIRTDITSHAADGSLYTKELFLRNPDPTKLSGNSWTAVPQFSNTGGSKTKYIEGKLRLAVSSSNTYKFPIGVAPTSLDGMEAVSLAFTGAFTTTNILAYIQPAATPTYSSDLITNGQSLFYDIGSLPAVSPANQFQNCVGTPDGHDDIASIDNAITHEWILTAAAATSNYNISVHPGSVLDNLSYVAMGTPCNSVYPKTKYLARNGRIGGDEAVGPTINYWNPGVTGLYQKPNGNLLSAQTAFSRFRIFGTTNPSNTSLPVELIDLKAEPINNEFIKVSWSTASELNNKGFVLLRSSTGSSFDSIAWINGNGNSNTIQNYVFDDRNVEHGIIYYYKLKQLDFNNDYNFSNTVSAQINSINNTDISIFPNPSNTNTVVNISSSINDEYSLQAYNAIGELMMTSVFKINANQTNQHQLYTNTWAKGMYLIKLQSAKQDKTSTLKFIKE